MGPAISLLIADELPDSRAQRLADDAFAWLHEVDQRFSTYRADSEVSRLNRAELSVDSASPDLRNVLEMCADLRLETDGYFDAYVTGLLDPSGYVKGWSVEVASAQLAEAGSVNHCLNAGGDVRTRGRPAPGQEWRVGVRHPWEADKLCWVLTGTDFAVATSGTYERGYHVIDPHHGVPA